MDNGQEPAPVGDVIVEHFSAKPLSLELKRLIQSVWMTPDGNQGTLDEVCGAVHGWAKLVTFNLDKTEPKNRRPLWGHVWEITDLLLSAHRDARLADLLFESVRTHCSGDFALSKPSASTLKYRPLLLATGILVHAVIFGKEKVTLGEFTDYHRNRAVANKHNREVLGRSIGVHLRQAGLIHFDAIERHLLAHAGRCEHDDLWEHLHDWVVKKFASKWMVFEVEFDLYVDRNSFAKMPPCTHESLMAHSVDSRTLDSESCFDYSQRLHEIIEHGARLDESRLLGGRSGSWCRLPNNRVVLEQCPTGPGAEVVGTAGRVFRDTVQVPLSHDFGRQFNRVPGWEDYDCSGCAMLVSLGECGEISTAGIMREIYSVSADPKATAKFVIPALNFVEDTSVNQFADFASLKL